MADVYAWLPDSIGGQSGSSVFDILRQGTVALLTWSNGTLGLGQSSKLVSKVLRERSFEMSSKIPPDFKPACKNPQPTEDGIHGEASTLPDEIFTTCAANGNGENGGEEPPVTPEIPWDELIQFLIMILRIIFGLDTPAETKHRVNQMNWTSLLPLLVQLLPLLLEHAPQIIEILLRIFQSRNK